MYNSDNNYSVMRDVLKEAPYSKKVHELTENTKVSSYSSSSFEHWLTLCLLIQQ